MKSIKKIWAYWKEAIVISIFCVGIIVLAEFLGGDPENPFYPNQLRTGEEIMAERWPHPNFSDPNFLRDYERYMGHSFYNPSERGEDLDFLMEHKLYEFVPDELEQDWLLEHPNSLPAF